MAMETKLLMLIMSINPSEKRHKVNIHLRDTILIRWLKAHSKCTSILSAGCRCIRAEALKRERETEKETDKKRDKGTHHK